MYISRYSLALLTVVVLAMLSACTTFPVEERVAVRGEINQAAAEIIAELIVENPELEAEISRSVGYMTGVVTSGTMLVVGGGTGIGVIFDKYDQSRTYVNLKRADIGAGLGVGRYHFLVVFNERESLLDFKDGAWKPSLGAESVTARGDSVAAVSRDKGFTSYALAEEGKAVSLTLRLVKVSVNHDLTNTGVSNVSIPMSGYDETGQQGEDAPRVWDHQLPFLAQKVLDEGYDLPLPYGAGLVYAYVEQDQALHSLQAGINGKEIEPFEFVGFENAVSKGPSWQLRYDTWLFPFMNVSAMVGTVNGDAPLDVILDGDLMLDHLGTDCSKIINRPLCEALEDNLITLPIEATFTGKTYSLGLLLAGGWKSYFVTIPTNWTYADMDDTDAGGAVLTVTPRVGKMFDLGDAGNLAVFVGGNYLDSELTVTGRVALPDDLVSIDYIIEQENTGKWNGVIGFNWDITRRWSLAAEYNGFFGSRKAYIASLTWRY